VALQERPTGLAEGSVVLKQNGQRTGGGRMKVIQGAFGGNKQDEDRINVPEVFKLITENEDLSSYRDALCIIKSEEYVMVSTNMDTYELAFLLDQLKLSLLTGGEYEL
tara:strand:- start:393 stop:716 length:324 start_codon:yes stop_codon:yes gene_type:complete